MKKRVLHIAVMVVLLIVVVLFGACSEKKDIVQPNDNNKEFSVSLVRAVRDNNINPQGRAVFSFLYTQEMFDHEFFEGTISLSCLINDSEKKDLGRVCDLIGIKYFTQSYSSSGTTIRHLYLKPNENVYFVVELNPLYSGKNKFTFELTYRYNNSQETKRQTTTIEIEL